MLAYLIKSSACLLVFSLFYRLFLEKENIHYFKRFYLLGSLALALYIPLITFTTYIEQPTAFQVSNTSFSNAVEVIPNEESIHWIPIILWAVYGLGTIFFVVKFLLNLYKLIRKINLNEKIQHKDHVHVLVLKHIVPHTFMKYIFLEKQAFKDQKIPREILLHEQTHALQKHSLDILFIELIQIVFWFNPLIYIFKKDIKLNHEFLADHEVIKHGCNTKNYQNILLNYSSKPLEYQLESSINYSSIKKRLTIMKTNTTKTTTWFRSFILLPILAILVYGFSEKKEIVKTSSLATPSSKEIKHSNYSLDNPQKELYQMNSSNGENYSSEIKNEGQLGASKEQLAEYNKLARHYNTMSKDNMVVKLDDLKRLKYIYSLMTEEQKKSSEPYPGLKIPPPPPPPSKNLSPEEMKAYKNMESRAREGKSYSWDYTNEEGKVVKVIANHKTDSIPPAPPKPQKNTKPKKAPSSKN